jgi:tetratricopeptide (TPR) repeat protein
MFRRSLRCGTALTIASLLGAGCATTPNSQRSLLATEKAADLRSKDKDREAAAAYTEALDFDPSNIVALRGYVEMQHRVGHTALAIARFRQAVARHPSDPYAHEGLGLALFTAGGGQSDEARAELTRATELAPTIADFQFRLGLFLVEGDNYEDASRALAKAISLDGHKAKYRVPYALALARTGDRAGATSQLQAILTLSPTKDEVALAEKTAQNLFDPFRAIPQAAREQWEIALGWLDHDATTQALQVLESLQQKYPDIAIVHSLTGLAAAKNDDASRAIYELRRAIELDPTLADPRLYLGDIYNSRGRPDNAREHYEAAVARNPFLALAYERLAEVHLHASDLEGAARLYGTYLLLRPTDHDALLAHAKVLTDLHSADAAGAWDNVAKEYPDKIEVLIGRAKYYFEVAAKAHDPKERGPAVEKCLKSLDKAMDIDPQNPTATAIKSALKKLP